MKRAYIDDEFDTLLDYIVDYRKARTAENSKRQSSRKMVVNQLILAYAKQLTVGMPEQAWVNSMIDRINACEIYLSNKEQ